MKRSKTVSSEIELDYRQLIPDVADHDKNSSSLVGDVLDSSPSESPGRVLVRWRALDGTLCERPVSKVRGLIVERGDVVLLHRPANWPEWLVTHVVEGKGEPPSPGEPLYQRANDLKPDVPTVERRIEIVGQDEVVLRCGEASITLRRNGRVVVRGAYIESRSRGTNRIKGGVVLIN